jgi:hypothetical protein
MTIGEQRDKQHLHHIALADDDTGDVILDGLRELCEGRW